MDEHKYLDLRNSIVRKSNDLIQKSRFSLSLQEQKAILYIISQIDITAKVFSYLTFEIVDFCKVCGIDNAGGKNYQILKSAIKKLRDKSLWVKLPNGIETLVSWIAKADIDERDGTIGVQLDHDMMPFLLNLRSNFTTYQLAYVLRMQKKRSPRLYEILKSYHYDGLKPYETTFTLDQLRELLDAKDQTYLEYKNFRRFILDPCVNEINEVSDIIVKYDLIKEKRKVVSIKFKIELKEPLDRIEAFNEVDKQFHNEKVSLGYKLIEWNNNRQANTDKG